MIRLIAIDLDGTLLDSSRTIPPKVVEAVRSATDHGVTIVPASGRIAPSIKPFAECLGLDGSMVCCNGAHVLAHDREILHVGLNAQASRLIVDYAFETREHLNIYCRDKLYFTSDPTWGELYMTRVKSIVPTVVSQEEARALEPTKMMIVADPAKMAVHHRVLAGRLNELSTDLVFSEPEYLEFLAAGANKATGLKAFADHVGIAREETAAIGDYLNDLDMVAWAGTGVAIGNAIAEVKAVADIIVSTNDEGGVAEFIYQHVLSF